VTRVPSTWADMARRPADYPIEVRRTTRLEDVVSATPAVHLDDAVAQAAQLGNTARSE
jgi:hypothetical protein